MFLLSLVKECSMLCSPLFSEELVLFLELSDAERLAFPRHFLSTLTVRLLFTSAVEKEATKWLKCWKNFLCWPLLRTAKKYLSCNVHHLSPTHPTCLSQPDRLPSILVLLSLSISEIWVEMCRWWLTRLPDGLRLWDKSQVDWQKCLEIQDIQLILEPN